MATPRIVALALAALVVLLAVPAVRHLREEPPPPAPVLRLALDAPPGTDLGSGDDVLDAAISHDGRQIVLVATRAGMPMLWRRALDADRAEALEGTEGAQLPAWSPGDEAVAFFAGGRLRRITLSSGETSDLADAPAPAGVTWLADGSILFAPDSSGPIRRLSNGAVSAATTLRSSDRGHVFPDDADGGDDFVYTAVADTGRRTVRLVRAGEDRDLETTSGHGAVAAGHLLYVRDDQLLARPLDESDAAGGDRAVRVASGVGVTTAGRGLFVASPRLLLTAAAVSRARALTWFDLTGTKTGTAAEPGDYWQIRMSPDDRYAAVTSVAPLLRTLDIVIVPTTPGADVEALTLALAADSDPVWTADGRRVWFRSWQSGRPALFSKRAHDRTAEDERLLEADLVPTDWRTGSVVVQQASTSSGSDIWSIDAGTGTRTELVGSSFNDTDGRWAPGGDWLAYVSDESGRPDIYAKRRSDGTRVRASFAGGTRPRWARDGRSLFFLRGTTVMRAALLDGSPARFAPAVPVLDAPGIRDFDLAHRRDALVALVPAGPPASSPVAAQVDWQSGLGAGH